MDLRNGQITVREVLHHPGAWELLGKRFPAMAGNPLLLKMAQNWTMNQVLSKAGGRLSPKQLEEIQRELETL